IEKMEDLVKLRMQQDALSVIISRYPCKMIDRSKGPLLYIDPEKCKKCRQCLALDCPAIYEEDFCFKINELLCTGCGLCKNVCKFEAIRERRKQ
ncbi:MAG: 4Fe-4S binding protein, partial [Candidatus Omnitrophica bacterium]|nr:4Fe-4S binding protein [Candidatus Omnitrophota bacterium]